MLRQWGNATRVKLKRETQKFEMIAFTLPSAIMSSKQMAEVEIWTKVGRADHDFLGKKALGWDSENQGLRL